MSRFGSFAVSLVLASVVSSSVARAGDYQPLPMAPAADTSEPYSPKVALGLSLGTTLAGAGAFALGEARGNGALIVGGLAGVLVGPSTGHFYSHHYLTRGMGLRAGGIVAALGGAYAMLDACPLFAEDEKCKDSVAGETLMILGGAAYLAGTIDDIVTAPGAARRRNRLIKSLSVAPVITSQQTGFAIAGSF